jgi:GNAT superfamily N-acetyltransferase
MEIALRPVEAADVPFLLAVYAGSRAAEMALVPWTPEQKAMFLQMQFAAQTADYTQRYPGARHEVICADGEPVGRVFLARLVDQFRIADLVVLPAHSGKGIGGWVLQRIMDEAARTSRPVTVYVEDNSPALPWFERRGFQRMGFSGYSHLMCWTPAP